MAYLNLLWIIASCLMLVSSQDDFSQTIWLYTGVTTDTSFQTTVSQSSELANSVHKALSWLVSQRDKNWGWRNKTLTVLMALQLAKEAKEPTSILPNNLEMQLAAKQMEIEVATLLWSNSRHNETPITPPKLTQHALALSSLCQDPSQSHGDDLISTLQIHTIFHDLDFAYITFVTLFLLQLLLAIAAIL